MDLRLHSLIMASRRFAKAQIPRNAVLEGFDLRPPEIHLLFSIEKGGGEDVGALGKAPFRRRPASQPSALAAFMGVTAGNVAQILAALEKRGLVERRVDPNDRRKAMVSITASGKKAVARAGKAYRDAYAGLLAELGEERTDEFVALLERSAGYLNEKFGAIKPMQP